MIIGDGKAGPNNLIILCGVCNNFPDGDNGAGRIKRVFLRKDLDGDERVRYELIDGRFAQYTNCYTILRFGEEGEEDASNRTS